MLSVVYLFFLNQCKVINKRTISLSAADNANKLTDCSFTPFYTWSVLSCSYRYKYVYQLFNIRSTGSPQFRTDYPFVNFVPQFIIVISFRNHETSCQWLQLHLFILSRSRNHPTMPSYCHLTNNSEVCIQFARLLVNRGLLNCFKV